MEAMKRISESSCLISGMNGIGVEIGMLTNYKFYNTYLFTVYVI